MLEVAEIYRSVGHEFKPHWFPTFYTLLEKGPMSIGHLAEATGVTHVSILNVIRELEAQGFAQSSPDPSDARVRIVRVTPKGEREGESLRPIWRSIRSAVTSAVDETGDDVLGSLARLEAAFDRQSFRARFAARYGGEIEIVTFRPDLAQAFLEINEEWITANFEMEPFDRRVLENPQAEILDRGGEVFFARDKESGEILGTCALMRHGADWELAKMGVRPAARRRGIGLRLGQAVIAEARRQGIRELVLATNARLKPAIALYAKLGFRQGPLPETGYARSDVWMVLQLDA